MKKGITRGVRFHYQFLFDWTIYTLPLDNIEQLVFKKNAVKHNGFPTFFRGKFDVEEIGDTFVELTGWKKGVVFINGFNLGRYWEVGPQETLYLPGPLLKKCENELIVFELHEHENDSISLINEHKLG
ncbi:hypothetical protein ACQKM9_17845 [Viridibacillus sp. NPDC093762]|uniref:hypothetical protein n=1 Tax=Viridibacillus sp. NPDC093762 TaxID=3390720 RepID=UPI003D0035D8